MFGSTSGFTPSSSLVIVLCSCGLGIVECGHFIQWLPSGPLHFSGCLFMALGMEPMALGPFHFLLCLLCPFSSAKWASYTLFASLTVKRKTPAPSFCGRNSFLAAGLYAAVSVCSIPSFGGQRFRKMFCSKSAIDFNVSRLTLRLPFLPRDPFPPL